MDMYMIGVIAGAGLVLALAVLIIVLLSRKGPIGGFSEKGYDERQQRARAISFKSGFFTLLTYNALYAFSSVLVDPWCDTAAGCFLGICLSATVFAVVCIMRDAYIPVRDNQKRYVILFGVMGAVNGLASLRFFLDPEESMIENGMLTFRSMNFVVTLMFIVILAAMLVKRERDRREEGEE